MRFIFKNNSDSPFIRFIHLRGSQDSSHRKSGGDYDFTG
jgi:hypothetical protein